MTDLIHRLIYKPESDTDNASDVYSAIQYLKSHQAENFLTDNSDKTITTSSNDAWYKHTIIKTFIISLVWSVVLFMMVYFKIPGMIPFSKNIFFNTLGVTAILFVILGTITFIIIR